MMSNATISKHASVEGISLDVARSMLRSSTGPGYLGLEEVIRALDCDAGRADLTLRALAVAGYIEPSDARCALFHWILTPNGRRLAAEKKRKRISTDKVQATIAALISRAREVNSDKDRLQRVTLKLFGSALEERENYGDVDVSIARYRRKLSETERLHIENELVSRQSEHERRTVIGSVMGAVLQDTREIRATLTKGLPHLSLMIDDPRELGCPFRWLVDHDLEADKPIAVTGDVVSPVSPLGSQTTLPKTLPPTTLIKARHRKLSPTTKVSVDGLSIGLDDPPRLDEAMWTPFVKRDGQLTGNDARDDPRVRFAGFQHLCSVWKEPIGGVLMLKLALDWCRANQVWVRDLAPIVSISRASRLNVIRLGVRPQKLRFEVGTHVQKGNLIPRYRNRVSKVDLAGAYAVGRALTKMYLEAGCAKVDSLHATIYLPSLEVDSLPCFPVLVKAKAFEKGAFPGLLDASSGPRIDG